MKSYTAMIANNNQTEVINLIAKNLTQAKEAAAKSGQVICVALNSSSKIHF